MEKKTKIGRLTKLVAMLLALAPAAVSCGSVTIETGAGWTPIAVETSIRAGSALDFSGLCGTREMAGAHGRVVAKGPHFEFEKLPGVKQRFYGVNLCFTGNFMSAAEADELCTRLARVGYNALRIHHYERDLCAGAADGTAIDQKRMAELDNLLTAAIRHGLYVTTDLYVSRRGPYRACGIDRDGIIEMKNYKDLALCHEGVFSNLVQFAKAFLGHVNAGTGRRWADEPALAFLSLINEGNPGNHGLADVRVNFGITTNAMDDAKFGAHLVACQRRFDRRMIDVLRHEIGYRGLVTNLNGWRNVPEFQELRQAYDYVDDHFYVDHPRFLEKPWRLPSECRNENPIGYSNSGIEWKKPARLEDRPFTISEWNFSGPGRYRGAGGIVFGAGAALQDMDGIWRFAWAHGHGTLLNDGKLGYFDTATDPLMLAAERAILALYLRGDMPVDRSVVNPFAKSANIRADKKSGTFVIETDRTCGVFAEPSDVRQNAEGKLGVVIRGHSAAVWATSLDGQPLAKSRRILLTHVTDVQDAGTVYRAADRKVLESWGHLPHLMANGTAEISLPQGVFRKTRVYALAADGVRRSEIPIRRLPYSYGFTADVARDPKSATYLYEIVHEY